MDSYYIFFVNRGHSLIIPINVNTTTVAKLNTIISKEVNLRTSEQILLGAKGVTLEPTKTLINYEGIGIKSSPLFLFQKSGSDREDQTTGSDVTYIYHMIDDVIDQTNYVLSNEDQEKIYTDLPDKVRECQKVATKVLHTCARLVEEHHFLHQGWQALIGNLDESVSKMKKRTTRFQGTISKMSDIGERSTELLRNFDKVLDQLKKIEVPFEILSKPSSLGVSQSYQVNPEGKVTLYDWIARADPNSSLEDVVFQVQDLINQFQEQNTQNVFSAINAVLEQSSNIEYRNIKGINKRFSQLDHSLITSEEYHKQIESTAKNITETPRNIDQGKLRNLIADQRQYFKEIVDLFEKLRNTIRVFDQSKQELLTNVCTRLSGFIVHSYDKLRYAHVEMVMYEEKCRVIRLRLDLIEQIKDSPILYSQTVSETVRRLLFKTDLENWHNEHSEKCEMLNNEETVLRKKIGKKLERHFLRSLFPGLFDDMPTFFIKSPLQQFDIDLPKIGQDYICSLRKSVPELEQFLKVKFPEVQIKLGGKDFKAHPPLGLSKREESFITKDPINVANSQYNYSPAHWLSEDGGDCSPVPASILMARSQDGLMSESQIGQAMPIVPSLQQLDGLNSSAPGTSIATSAPIAIPTCFVRSAPREANYSSHSSDVALADNERNDDNNLEEQQFVVDDVSNSTHSLDFLNPMKLEIATISKGLRDVRSDLQSSSYKLKEDFTLFNDFLKATLPVEMVKFENKRNEEIQKLMSHVSDLTIKLQASEKSVVEKEALLAELKCKSNNESKENFEVIQRLKEQLTKCEKEVKSIESETFKKLTIEYELMNDRTRTDYEDQLAIKDQEIMDLKKELEKKNAELLKEQQSDPFSDDFKKGLISEIRVELEKEYKSRIERITNAVEQKKDESIARIRKEFEVEVKVLSQENESKAKKLQHYANEREQLRRLIETQLPDGPQILVYVDNSLEGKGALSFSKDRPLSNLRTPLNTASSLPEMDESVFEQRMEASTVALSPFQSEGDIEAQVLSQDEKTCSISTQTKIGLTAMNLMVTVQDIKPGNTVLVIWDHRHNAYLLFCSSQYRHFLKKSSVRRLGLLLPVDSTAPRRNWVLGRVVKLEKCAVKKPVNRYNLNVGTVVQRVEVEPVNIGLNSDETVFRVTLPSD